MNSMEGYDRQRSKQFVSNTPTSSKSNNTSISKNSPNNNYTFDHNDVQTVNIRREKRALNMVKKDLEMLYKEYVMLACTIRLPKDSPESHSLINFEKKLNKTNEKT